MISRAQEITRNIEELPEDTQGRFLARPYDWNEQSDDDLFTHIAYNARRLLRQDLPHSNMSYTYNEAWLLDPKRWTKGYELSGENNNSRRRLFVTLHRDFEVGDQSTANVVDKSGLTIIADNQYKDLDAFKNEADSLLFKISQPYIAPNVVAEDIISKQGYDFMSFGD
ncbi:MAG: hypothetical protein KAS23_05035 [Anaerohalosphaera sp.]|nr:hypothetical protein [Anaerohalosphaera sp.]